MKLLVLAAGKGTRLKPYTDKTNKCMIHIANKPLLYHNLLQCKQACLNLDEIVIVVGYLKEQIIQYFGNEFMGVPIIYVHQENLDGIAGAVALAKPFLDDQPFILVLGDMILVKPHLKEMINKFNEMSPDGICGVVTNKSVEEMQDNYTIQFDKHNRIELVVDKPNKPFNDFMGTGYFIFSPSTLKYVQKTPICPLSKQRGICEWIMLCINNNLNFYFSIVGEDAININNVNMLNQIKKKFEERNSCV